MTGVFVISEEDGHVRTETDWTVAASTSQTVKVTNNCGVKKGRGGFFPTDFRRNKVLPTPWRLASRTVKQ